MGPVCAEKSGLIHPGGIGTRSFHDARTEEDTSLREALLLRRDPQGSEMDLVRTNVPHLVVHHSPTGFEFGYGGSGPADLALNVMHFFVEEMDLPEEPQPHEDSPFEKTVECFEGEVSKVAWDLHQSFKDEFIAAASEYGTRIDANEIRQWIIDCLYDADVDLEDVEEGHRDPASVSV